jgi:hypothetical protein
MISLILLFHLPSALRFWLPVLFGTAKVGSFSFPANLFEDFFLRLSFALCLVFNRFKASRFCFSTCPFRDCKGEDLFSFLQEVF